MFWELVDQSDEFGCWPFRGGAMYRIHMHPLEPKRAAWWLEYGRPLDSWAVESRCGTPKCVRPAHLKLVEYKAPEPDARSRKSHLAPERVAEIRQKRAEGVTCTDLAAMYGISISQASRIVTGKRWR